MTRSLLLATAVLLLFANRATTGGVFAAEFSPQQLEYFEKEVRPLLIEHCYECHSGGATKLQAALRVDFRDALLHGGDSGPVIVPGNADESLLMQSVRYESYEMPPKGKLADSDIARLEKWINDGAAWPDEPPPEASGAMEAFDLSGRKASHWAWQALNVTPPPPVTMSHWAVSPIDHFVLNKLESAHLRPAPPVDRHGLIRRLAFDLTGLPPTPAQVEAFVADSAPDATEKLVDCLLSSDHFGERWGRHWLDLVRYAESRGHEFDHDAINAFQYRDYVIRAFNADVPYDQFVTEHIAGDLLESPRLHPDQRFNESILGTGFWFLGEWVHSPVDIRKDESDRFDNMIDVMTKTFLGLTVACARCHDHKFDAITTADYYALSGFLQSSDFRQVRFDTLEQERQLANDLDRLDRQYRAEVEQAISPWLPSSLAGDWKLPQLPSTLVDFSRIDAADYIQDGFIFGPSPTALGTFQIESSDTGPAIRVAALSAAVSDRFWDGLSTTSEHGVEHRGRLGGIAMSGRTLRTPTVGLDSGHVEIRAKGAGHIIACVDSHRLILGPLHNETVVHFQSPDAWTWVRMNLNRYVGHRIHFEFVPDRASTLEIAWVGQNIQSDHRAAIEDHERRCADVAGEIQRLLDGLVAGKIDPSPPMTRRHRLNRRSRRLFPRPRRN